MSPQTILGNAGEFLEILVSQIITPARFDGSPMQDSPVPVRSPVAKQTRLVPGISTPA